MQNNEVSKVRRRPRADSPFPKSRSSFTYTVTVGRKSMKVCQAAFVALHGIKAGRLKKKVLQFDKDITDGRGKHDEHSKLSDELRDRVREHIRMFPARESHYSRSHNVHHRFLDASLTVAAMHKLFLEQNPDLKDDAKYWL